MFSYKNLVSRIRTPWSDQTAAQRRGSPREHVIFYVSSGGSAHRPFMRGVARFPPILSSALDIIRCAALFYKLGAAPKNHFVNKKFGTLLPRNLKTVKKLKVLIRLVPLNFTLTKGTKLN